MVMQLPARGLSLAVLVGIVGCPARPPPAPTPAASAARQDHLLPPVGLLQGTDGRQFAVVHWIRGLEECSGAGGHHDILEIDEPGDEHRLAHAGGHYMHLGLGPSQQFGFAHPVGPEFFVAELVMVPRAGEDHDANPDSSVGGWCLADLPRTDAKVSRLLPAQSLLDARRMLTSVAAIGMPPPMFILAPRTGSELSVARVRAIHRPGWTLSLDAIDGRPPAALDLPATYRAVQIGDLLVVESDAGGPTRVLAPENLATARMWVNYIRRHAWPIAPIVNAIEETIAMSRWTMVGAVIPGATGCGALIEGNRGYGSVWNLPKLVATAPPGIAVGDTVIAVSVARFDNDRCGANLRAVRVYRTPGFTSDKLATDGIPEGLTPIVE
jgi:hypothetical protein